MNSKLNVLFLCDKNCARSQNPRKADGTQLQQIESFRRVRDQIHQKVLNWLEEVQREDRSKQRCVVMR